MYYFGNRPACWHRGGLSKTDEELVFETSTDLEVIPTFDELGLREDLLRGIYAFGATHIVATAEPCRVCMRSRAASGVHLRRGCGR